MLCIQDADFGYDSKVILHIKGLTLKIGEKISLVGPSGCGKTTLLSVIAGSSELLRGRIEFWGAPQDSRWRVKHVARTLQAFPLLHWLTVRQNLQLAYRIRQSQSDDKAAQKQARIPDSRVDEVLFQLSASHLADLYPKQLSGGERCRASLAQSVIGNPRILLLDEPFTGLDLLVKKDVAQAIFSFAERNSISVIFVTHDLEDAAAFSDRVFVLGQRPVTQIVADIPVAGASTAAAVEAILKERA